VESLEETDIDTHIRGKVKRIAS